MRSTPAPRVIPLYIVVPPRMLMLDVAGPVDVVRRANIEQQALQFDVRHVAPRASIMTSVGLVVSGLAPLPGSLPDDAMILLGGNVTQLTLAGDPAAARDRADEAAIVAWLRAVVRPSHTVISICSGALFAARAGLLDGYRCTTHHQCTAQLAAIAPRAHVLEDRLYVEDGRRLTSAGITAGIDLMLHVVAQQIGQAHALSIARYLVVYMRRDGAEPQLSPWLEGRNHLHPIVHKVQDAIAAHPRRAWPTEALARLAGTSVRHLSRLFREHTGMNLPDYRNRVRVALAHELLVQTQLDIERVAERAGFASARQLRRAWRKWYSTPPRTARDEPARAALAAPS
ncbi:MAG TPA: helix-turn-helix domain-containing protein [Kofleriaceae bacterium]|nr:helix-turn-helix domain-containing protein [Kofleriaceae bacterium]